MEHAIRIALFAFGAVFLFACGAERATPVEACTGILESKVPSYEVVGIVLQPLDRTEITYATPDEGGAPVERHLLCEVERSGLGGLRLRTAILDGRPLSDTELVVLNANLLLDELYWLGKRSG